MPNPTPRMSAQWTATVVRVWLVQCANTVLAGPCVVQLLTCSGCFKPHHTPPIRPRIAPSRIALSRNSETNACF